MGLRIPAVQFGPRFTIEEDGEQNPPPEATGEYATQTWVGLTVDAGFTDDIAYGEALADFVANNAIVKADLELSGTIAGNAPTREEQDTWFFPSEHSLHAITSYDMNGTKCGATATATGSAEIWASMPWGVGAFTWGKKRTSGTHRVSLTACPSGGGGSGGGGGGTVCFEVYENHYDADDNWLYSNYLGRECYEDMT